MAAYFTTISAVKRAHEVAGGHFFGRNAMRGFKTRIGNTVYGGRYFITSEANEHWHPKRRYSVREIDSDRNIKTIGEVGEHKTWQQARREISRLINEGVDK